MHVLSAIKLFARAAQLGSVSAAARAAGISIASASRQISALEKHLHARLLNRGARTLTLTEAGDMLLHRVRPLIEEFDAALEAVDTLHAEPRGLVRVHVRSTIATHFLLPNLPKLLADYPELMVEMIVSNDNGVDIIRENIDVDVRYSQPDSLDLVAVKLGNHRMNMVLVASPDYVARHGAPAHPADLADHLIIGHSDIWPNSTWQCAGPGGRVDLIPVKPRSWFNEGATMRAAALNGLGVALMAQWIVQDELSAGRLVPLLPTTSFITTPPTDHIYAVYQRSRYQAAKLRAFLRFLQEIFRAHDAPWPKS